MTKDEFIKHDTNNGPVILTGDLAGIKGDLLLVKGAGDTDGALARPEDFADFVSGYAHAYADGRIMRYHREIGDISMIQPAPVSTSNRKNL